MLPFKLEEKFVPVVHFVTGSKFELEYCDSYEEAKEAINNFYIASLNMNRIHLISYSQIEKIFKHDEEGD